MQLFSLFRGHVLQSGITRESLKVSPMLDRTAAEAAMFLFWSHGPKRPMGKEHWRDDVSAVTNSSDSRERCCFTYKDTRSFIYYHTARLYGDILILFPGLIDWFDCLKI